MRSVVLRPSHTKSESPDIALWGQNALVELTHKRLLSDSVQKFCDLESQHL